MQYKGLTRYLHLALVVCWAAVLQASDAQPLLKTDQVSRIPFDVANVASADGRVFVISWHADGVRHIRIYAGTDPTHVGRVRSVGEGTGAGKVTVQNLPAAPRWYFELVPDRGDPLVIADRSVHLTTAANFRDAGGYRNEDGKWVRVGLAYRSNGIEHLTDEELTRVGELNIKLICDLRTAEERNRGPDRVPEGVEDIPADVLADDAVLLHSMMVDSRAPSGSLDRQNANAGTQHPGTTAPEIEQRVYRDFVRSASARQAYGLLFARLADPSALPTVFHCTAGKDRTGWAEAVFLMILRVPRSTIIQDYELTNEYLRGDALKSVRQSISQSAASHLIANPVALEAAFDEVMKDYGSFDRYLNQGLRLSDATLAAIRRNFLAD